VKAHIVELSFWIGTCMSAEDDASWASYFAEFAAGIGDLGADELDVYILVEDLDGYTLPEDA